MNKSFGLEFRLSSIFRECRAVWRKRRRREKTTVERLEFFDQYTKIKVNEKYGEFVWIYVQSVLLLSLLFLLCFLPDHVSIHNGSFLIMVWGENIMFFGIFQCEYKLHYFNRIKHINLSTSRKIIMCVYGDLLCSAEVIFWRRRKMRSNSS